jgi:nitric-oxide synthase
MIFLFPQPTQCSQQACLGSVVSLQTRNTTGPRSKEEVLRHAKDFLEQYFTSIRRSVQPQF